MLLAVHPPLLRLEDTYAWISSSAFAFVVLSFFDKFLNATMTFASLIPE